MSFVLVVKLEVRDEEGNLVDYKGRIGIGQADFRGLETAQNFREFAHIENAHITLNNLHAAVASLVKLGGVQ